MELLAKMCSRRVIQLFWVAAALVFIMALTHMSAPAKQWTNVKIQKIFSSIQTTGRNQSVSSFLDRSEEIWAKTVKDRHEMLAADYANISEMPMYVFSLLEHMIPS